jgi:hypothetical protein
MSAARFCGDKLRVTLFADGDKGRVRTIMNGDTKPVPHRLSARGKLSYYGGHARHRLDRDLRAARARLKRAPHHDDGQRRTGLDSTTIGGLAAPLAPHGACRV